MTIRVLDPSSELAAVGGTAAPRLGALAGKTVGFISNGKEGTAGYFHHLGRLMQDELGVGSVVLRVKSNYSAPADPHIIEEIGQWDAVISGLGD